MYRPVVRCDDLFRDYIEKTFQSTFLDRNQIIRLMMFSSPFNEHFQEQIKKYLKPDTTLPLPEWGESDHGLWLEQTYKKREGEEGLHADTTRGRYTSKNTSSSQSTANRREGIRPSARPPRQIQTAGRGITITVG